MTGISCQNSQVLTCCFILAVIFQPALKVFLFKDTGQIQSMSMIAAISDSRSKEEGRGSG